MIEASHRQQNGQKKSSGSAGALLYVLPLVGLLACSASRSVAPENGVLAEETWTLNEDDFSRPWVVLQVPLAANESVQGLTRGPDGFWAVVYENHSEGKVIKPGNNRLATSADGASWSSSILESETYNRWRQIVQARGRIIIVGAGGQGGLIRSSTDGQSWDIQQTPTSGLWEVDFVNGYFFALGATLGGLLVSDDGVTWQDRSQKTAQNNAVAFGNGRWVVAGNTEFFTSTDTVTWESSTIECTDAATCPGVTPPDWQPGEPVAIVVSRIFFAHGTFYADTYVSTDGYNWSVISDPAHAPSAFEGDLFLRFTADSGVSGSEDAETWSMQTTLTSDNPAGYTCADHPCFIVDFLGPEIGRAIVLVPRP